MRFLSFAYVTLFLLITGLDCKLYSSMKGLNASDDCQLLLESFAGVTSNFTYCTIWNARPITLCKSCVQAYIKVKEVYTDITQLETEGGGKCKDQLFNLDRLQVVDSGFQYVNNLWGRAYCESCFMNDKSLIIAPRVVDILNTSSELQACIREHRNDSEVLKDPKVCSECFPFYEKLNIKYNSLKASTGDINFCMDIVDLINSTRFSWSGDMGCCQDRKKPELVFLASSFVIALAPVIFYIAAFTFSGKKEQKLAKQKRLTEYFQHMKEDPST